MLKNKMLKPRNLEIYEEKSILTGLLPKDDKLSLLKSQLRLYLL